MSLNDATLIANKMNWFHACNFFIPCKTVYFIHKQNCTIRPNLLKFVPHNANPNC